MNTLNIQDQIVITDRYRSLGQNDKCTFMLPFEADLQNHPCCCHKQPEYNGENKPIQSPTCKYDLC